MKRDILSGAYQNPFVAPFVGAWMETEETLSVPGWRVVAPFVGAWIETVKYRVAHAVNPVAPFAGARIEIAG